MTDEQGRKFARKLARIAMKLEAAMETPGLANTDIAALDRMASTLTEMILVYDRGFEYDKPAGTAPEPEPGRMQHRKRL